MNKTIPFQELYGRNFKIDVLSVTKHDWRINNIFSCINHPKTKNNILYLHNYNAEYTFKDGRIFHASNGDVVINPIGVEYSVKFSCNAPDGCTIGINAMFEDENNENIIPEGDILIIHTLSDDYLYELFSDINDAFMSAPLFYAKIKSNFYEMLSELLRTVRNEKHIGKKYEVIKKGILYMESGNCSEIKIREIADMCNVSEVYFRRLFKEYSGVSPVEYIINSRIERAKKYLKYENTGICDIAYRCGFESESYFSRLFKKKTGLSPKKYREKY